MANRVVKYLKLYSKVFEEQKCCPILFWIGLVITISLLWPLVVAPYFSHHDDVQAVRLFEMDKCIKDGQIPCRWVPDLGGLYGYPLFNFYAPLPYYIGEIFYLIFNNLMLSAKVMFGLSFVGSYVFMYLAARKLWGDKGGMLSAVFYSLAPYHSVVFYVRGAMGEMWSLMFYPAIFWAMLRLKESPRVINLLLLSIFIMFLSMSHNLSTMIFLPITITFAGLLFFEKRNFKFLKYIITAIILGLTMSAFYWLPMLTEKNLVHIESTIGGYFSYTEHFKGLRKLFLDNSWGWGASVREVPGGEKDGLSFQIGWVHVLGWLLALFVACYFWKKRRDLSLIIIFFSVIIVLSIFMINPRSEFVWKIIDPLKYLQFPWRFLMIIIFFISLIIGSIIMLFKEKMQLIVLVGAIILVIAVNFSYFRPEKFTQMIDQQLLTGVEWDKQIKRSIFDFLPIYAKAPPAELQPARFEVTKGEAIVKNYKEGTNWFNFQADTSPDTTILLSKYYFPDWKVFVDGKEVVIDYGNNFLGLINVTLGSGSHTVTGRLYDTPIRILGNLISVLGILIYLILLTIQIQKNRNK